MGARSFTEVDAWQLANELKLGVYALIRADRVRRDVDFVRQIRNAGASAPRNIAEGFGRYQPREFGQYLRVANGSLMETSNHLQDGVDRGYFTPEQGAPLLVLARRASAATTALALPSDGTPSEPEREHPKTTAPENCTQAPAHPGT